MVYYLSIVCFIFGTVIGSFLNVIIYRLPRKLSPAKGRSMCPSCERQLTAIDMIPIISYIFLRGKCRTCKNKISLRYPLVELLTGILYVLSYLTFGYNLQTLFAVAFFSLLVVVSFIDLDTQEIPNGAVIAVLVLAVARLFTVSPLLDYVIGAFAISVPLFLLALFTNGFGLGDVKLMFACGLFMGWQLLLLAFIIAAITAAAVGIVLMCTRRASRKTAIPFGPFLCLGMAVSLLFGNQLIAYYLSLLF